MDPVAVKCHSSASSQSEVRKEIYYNFLPHCRTVWQVSRDIDSQVKHHWWRVCGCGGTFNPFQDYRIIKPSSTRSIFFVVCACTLAEGDIVGQFMRARLHGLKYSIEVAELLLYIEFIDVARGFLILSIRWHEFPDAEALTYLTRKQIVYLCNMG